MDTIVAFAFHSSEILWKVELKFRWETVVGLQNQVKFEIVCTLVIKINVVESSGHWVQIQAKSIVEQWNRGHVWYALKILLTV